MTVELLDIERQVLAYALAHPEDGFDNLKDDLILSEDDAKAIYSHVCHKLKLGEAARKK